MAKKAIKISMKRVNDHMLMEATNERGSTLRLDATPDVGGENGGLSPMESVLSAAGACSTIDIISILKKQKQPVEDIQLSLEGERTYYKDFSEFTNIHIHYVLKGDLDPKKVERAMNLSLERYCSVLKLLEKTAKVKGTFEIVP